MASNVKVDIVRPTATNGSLSLKGDSGGSATTNGVTVDSSGNTSITGTTTVSSLVATTADINGGTIDDTTIGGTTPASGSFTQVNSDTIKPTTTDGSLSIKGDSGGSATSNGITVNSSGNTSITGTTTVSSLVATTADINGGTIDDVTLGVNTAVTEAQIDNINIDGNTISSTNTNGDINLTPNGTGNVGIGATSSPDAKLHVATSADNATFPNSFDYSDATAIFSTGDTGSADGFVKFLSGLYNAASTNNLDLIVRNKDNNYDAGFRITAGSGSGIATNNGYLSFSRIATDGTTINATERLRIDSSGNVRADKFTDLAGTGAPDFPNGLTLAGNAISGNITGVTLDDYEEGTWAPTTSAGTISYANTGYRKIGTQVTVWGFVSNFSDKTTATGLTINNLPFNVNSSYADVGAGSAMWQYSDVGGDTIYIDSNSKLQFYAGTTSGSFTQLKHNNLNNANARVYFTATYISV